MNDGPERYQLTLQALPDAAPAIIRLRRVLKSLLRSYGFRCVAAVELHETPDATEMVRADAADAVVKRLG